VTGFRAGMFTEMAVGPPGCGPSGSCNPMDVRVLSPTPVPHGLDLKARPPLNLVSPTSSESRYSNIALYFR
jgi:hypothetical protein